MSAGRYRTPTNAERRAARRQAARPQKPGRSWLWVVAAGLAAIGVAIFVVMRLSADSAGTVAGEPAGNTSVGSGPELSQIRTPDFHSMAVSPVDPNLVLYGHHGGVLRSTDGGRTWQTTNLTGQTDDAMGMGFAGAAGETIFAAGHDTFFKSEDAGLTWERIKPKLPGTDVHGLAVAPDDPNRLYAHVVRYGLFRSDDGGESWAKAATVPGDIMTLTAGPDGRVYAASMSQGILRSDDGGQTFTATGRDAATLTVAASATDADIVYAGAEDAVYVSTDGGASWEQKSVPGGGQVMVAAVNPSDPMDITVVAVQSDSAGHVFRSTDGGTTWGQS